MDQRTVQHKNRRRAQRAARNAQLDAELASYSVSRWLSVPQWARARGISVWFAYEEARKGRLKITKAGRRSFVTPEADKAGATACPCLTRRLSQITTQQALKRLLRRYLGPLKNTEPARGLCARALVKKASTTPT